MAAEPGLAGRGVESEMPVPRLTERRKAAVDAAMRDGLFEAAVAVIAQHGSAGLTMERLAIAARVAKGSVYNYFRSKRGLLQFVYQKAYEPINVQMHEIAASRQTARGKLEAMARMYFEHVNQERELFAFSVERRFRTRAVEDRTRQPAGAGD